MEIIPAETKPLTPWKNGAGLTREIAVYGDETCHQDFLWRISMAIIDAPCTFSRFDGVDRSIAVLEGEGIVLKSTTNPVDVYLRQESLAFRGEEEITATPIKGTTTDLNVMTRRGFFEHHMEYYPFAKEMAFKISAELTFIVARSEVIIEGQTLHPFDSATNFAIGDEVTLKSSRKGEVFIIEIYSYSERT